MIDSSENLTQLKDSVLGGGDNNILNRIKAFANHYGIGSETVKNLSISALLTKLYAQANDTDKDVIMSLVETAGRMGIASNDADSIFK